MLQHISGNFPKVALTSAFVERLQSEWTLEHLQQISEAVKVEYGASRAGYALEVYLGLQRLQNSAENGSFSEAEDVKELLDGLKVDSAFCTHIPHFFVWQNCAEIFHHLSSQAFATDDLNNMFLYRICLCCNKFVGTALRLLALHWSQDINCKLHCNVVIVILAPCQ